MPTLRAVVDLKGWPQLDRTYGLAAPDYGLLHAVRDFALEIGEAKCPGWLRPFYRSFVAARVKKLRLPSVNTLPDATFDGAWGLGANRFRIQATPQAWTLLLGDFDPSFPPTP